MMKTTLTLIASLALGLGIASADDKKSGETKKELWQQYDTNGDGHLCEKEREEIRKGIMKRRAAVAKLQGGEKGPAADARALQPGLERGAAAKAALLKKFDKNGDGQLCEAERAEAKKAMAARAGDAKKPEAGKKIGAALLEKFDKDGDGKLNEAERAAAKKAMGESRKKRGAAKKNKAGN